MNRTIMSTAVLATATGLIIGTAVAPTAADAAPSKISRADARFLRSNEQVNLAEISLGSIALHRSTGRYAVQLARTTTADHRSAMKANRSVARANDVTLPTTPNKLQLATAVSLQGVRQVAHHYFAEQIKGHRLSIAQTKVEIANGKSAAVVKYARYYLPVAQMHLAMSLRDLHRYNRFS